MARGDPDEFWPELEGLGEEEVRRRLAAGAYYGNKLESVRAWLESKEAEREGMGAERDRAQ